MTQENSIGEADFQAGATAHGAGPGQPLPLTEAQSEVWVASQISPEASAAFKQSCSIWLKGPFHEGSMRRALAELTRRHAALRARFHASGDGQMFADEAGLRLETRNLSGLPEGERAAVLRGIQEAEGERVFDLAAGPLLAAQIVRMEGMVHVVVLTVHHIVCDGWSYDIVLRELSALYSAGRRGVDAALPPAVPYAAFLRWEEDRGASAAGQASEAYWRSRYRTLPPMLALPADRPYPPQRSYHGARVSRRLSTELCGALRRSVARREVTLFSQLLAAAAALVRHLSGERDLVIGVPAAGQNAMGVDPLVGHCANLLPLRMVLEDGMDSGRFAQQVQGWVLDAMVHQAYTLGALLRRLPVVRAAGRVPLVSVFFNLEQPPNPPEFELLTHRIEPNPRRRYQFDLGFRVVENGEGLTVECDFNTDIVDASTAERWLGHYEMVVQQMVADPGTALEALVLMGPEQCLQWTMVANDTERPIFSPATVPEILASAMETRSSETAVEAGGQSLTVSELDARSNRLASHLRALGVRPGVQVGVCCERTVDFPVAVLGVMKAGGACVPVDPDLPPERLEWVLADAAVSVLVIHESLSGRMPATSALVVCLDRDAAELDALPPAAPMPLASPGGLAYVMYIRGPSGELKGVEIQHRALVNFLESMRCEPGLTRDDVFLAVTPLWRDIAHHEILLSLLAGARCVMAVREDLEDPMRLSALMERCGATVMQATAAVWRRLLDSGWSGRRNLKAWCGGAVLAPQLAARLRAACGELWNMYGSAETAGWSLLIRVSAGDSRLMGRPIANAQFHVVDGVGRLVAPGIVGELLIGGVGLSRGYRNRPDLTSERFIRDPFCGGENRVFRTGERVRRHADGRIEFMGRPEDGAMARGLGSEWGQVGVHRLGVEISPTPGELRLEPPHSETEKKLAVLWADVLRVESVDRSDSFFERGGHSMLAVVLCGRIEKEFGHRLPLATLFGAPSLAALAALLEPDPVDRPDWPLLVPIQRKGGEVPFFCVHGTDGGVLLYRDLARCLGESQPFFGFQCEGLDGRSAPLATVEQMAERYVEVLTGFYPGGPIRLGGAGVGGLVAYEMACRLHQRGREVALLALFDSSSNVSMPRPNSQGSRMHGSVPAAGSCSFNFSDGTTGGRHGWRRHSSMWEKLRRVREAVVDRVCTAGRLLVPRRADLHQAGPVKSAATLAEIHNRAAAHYNPRSYPGRLTLFRPRRKQDQVFDPHQGWGDLAGGGVDVVEVPIHPQGMFVEPDVGKLAERLRRVLAATTG